MSPAADETKTLEQFLAEPRTAILATIRGDGHPQMTLNWFYWDGSRFFVSTTRTRKKYPNVRRDPRVQIAINDSTSLRAVLVDGHAEILEDVDEQLPYMMEIAKKYERIPEFIQLGYAATDDWRARLVEDERVMLAITPNNPPAVWPKWGFR